MALTIDIVEEPATALVDYARIPIAFIVDRVLDVTPRIDAPGGFTLSERRLDVPYRKDYDAFPGDGPLCWADRFDLSQWGFFAARSAGRKIGAAAVALDIAGLTFAPGPRDPAWLWDIRVAPDARGQGAGTALFAAVKTWAQTRGRRHLTIETQNVNVAACRFYERQGCVLRVANHGAYPESPEEVQLLWGIDLPVSNRR